MDVSQVDFPSEASLQEFVAKYPRLLSGDEGSPDGLTDWLFVAREMGIPSEENQGDGRSVNHLFLDREDVPTLHPRSWSLDEKPGTEPLCAKGSSIC